MEVEDDLFFADLSRQISLLIMDDDDDDDHEDHPVARCPAVSFQAFSRSSSAYYPSTTTPSPFLYDQQQSCKRESKGTGVFIPQSSQLRRKNKQGRFSSFNTTKSHSRQQQHDHHNNKARTTVSQQSSYNHNSLYPKKGLSG